MVVNLKPFSRATKKLRGSQEEKIDNQFFAARKRHSPAAGATQGNMGYMQNGICNFLKSLFFQHCIHVRNYFQDRHSCFALNSATALSANK
jgi:hypothetical protein